MHFTYIAVNPVRHPIGSATASKDDVLGHALRKKRTKKKSVREFSVVICIKEKNSNVPCSFLTRSRGKSIRVESVLLPTDLEKTGIKWGWQLHEYYR